jgi:ketosteroid isomerase-like protein
MSAEEAVARHNVSLSEAMEAGDLERIVDHFTEDVIFLMPGSPPIEGKQAAAEWWKGFLDAGLERGEMSSIHIEERGDLVIEAGSYSMDLAPDGVDPISDTGKYIVVYRRGADGEVRAWMDIVNSDAPAAG